MTNRQMEQIWPWRSGLPTDILGCKPPPSLISSGYITHVRENFYLITDIGMAELREKTSHPGLLPLPVNDRPGSAGGS